MANPRNTAFQILLKIEQDKAYSNLALAHAVRAEGYSGVDSAFVSALVYGVLERQLCLDYILRQYSKIPLRKIEIKTKLILRMGILQLLFMDKVPESAAVNESVKLAKKHGLTKSSGFINGILRSITRAEVRYTLPDESKDLIYALSIRYSAPQELVRLWMKSYGEDNTRKLLQSLNGRPGLYARVNTLRTDAAALTEALARQGVEATPVSGMPDTLSLRRTGAVESLEAYRQGLFHIQDISSQRCVALLAPQPRDIMLDVCAAPGGKSFTAAQLMRNCGSIFACDLYDHKLRLMQEGAKRLGIDILRTVRRDASQGSALPTADRILCDVPCSGLGILSRKPEIRYKDGLIDSGLPQLQYKILCESAKYLAAGGRLVYSTCTLHPAENNENVRRFLSEHPDFTGVPITLPDGVIRAAEEEPYELTQFPHTAGGDGFYTAVLTRRS